MKAKDKVPGMFGEWLRSCRRECGMTLQKVAAKCGTHKGYISGIETGAVSPPAEKLCLKLAKLFGFKAAEVVLMSWIDKAPPTARPFVKAFAYRLMEREAAQVRGCLLAREGRGDCEHFVGLPKVENAETTDVYGVPHGWCIVCWLQVKLERANKKSRETA
jgi:transcriptional regulator with XRE-family HTH domain